MARGDIVSARESMRRKGRQVGTHDDEEARRGEKGDGEPKKTKGEVRWIIGSRDCKANPLRARAAPVPTGTNRALP